MAKELKYDQGAFDITYTPFTEVSALNKAIDAAFEGADGWVQYASGIVAQWGAKGWKSGDGRSGHPLAGEWTHGDTSWNLRTRGSGWVLTTMRRGPGSDRIVTHSHSGDAFGKQAPSLRYEVLWSKQEQRSLTPAIGVWTATHSRFVGFGKEQT